MKPKLETYDDKPGLRLHVYWSFSVFLKPMMLQYFLRFKLFQWGLQILATESSLVANNIDINLFTGGL